MKTFAEQIRALENTRAAKAAAMAALMERSVDAGSTLDDAAQEEFDTLDDEVSRIDKDLERFRKLEKVNITRAQPLQIERDLGLTTDADAATRQRGITVHVKAKDKEDRYKGQSFTRCVIAKARAYMLGGGIRPSEVAEQLWGKTNPTLVQVIKANEIAVGGSVSPAWGSELADADTRYTGDFIEYLYAATVYDRLPLRPVPANVTIKGQDGVATGFWVGQGKAIPASVLDFMSVTLTRLKVGAIAAISKELIKDATVDSEMLVRDGLVNASGQRVDQTFFSTTAASAGVSPAGILNGLTAITASGTNADAVYADVDSLYAPFITAHNASGLMFVMNTGLAKSLQLMRNPLGQQEFPTVSQAGGTLLGDGMMTGDNVAASNLILLKPSDIYRIGETGVEISISDAVTLEMSSAPTGANEGSPPTAAGANQQNIWQEDSVAIKVVRPVNFAKRRASAVAYVGNAAYKQFVGSP